MTAPVARTRTRGRPCGLTAERQTALIAAIERGLPLREAALLAGVSYDSLNRWRKQGESEDAPHEFREFFLALERAQAAAMDTMLSHISSAARQGNWKAAAWSLERRFPDVWGRPSGGAARLNSSEEGANTTTLTAEQIKEDYPLESIQRVLLMTVFKGRTLAPLNGKTAPCLLARQPQSTGR